tara:strand:+ start:184 stop:702 length:519 start_codon:yes stop_codon:yes gene_type:complete
MATAKQGAMAHHSNNGLLSDKWALWAHLPHDTDWSLQSYKKIMEIKTVPEMIAVTQALPEKLIKNCMLFIMRKDITPRWEDPKNCEGGCFSFKVTNKNVPIVWKHVSYLLVGETLCKLNNNIINGITISPKRSFCIVKIWLRDCKHQSPSILAGIPELATQGCLFKRHNPEN